MHERKKALTEDASANALRGPPCWASGFGDWGECGADDDDDFDEPGAWRDSMALGDCDA